MIHKGNLESNSKQSFLSQNCDFDFKNDSLPTESQYDVISTGNLTFDLK